MNGCDFCGYITNLEEYDGERLCIICASTHLANADDEFLAMAIAYLANTFIDALGIGDKVDAAFDRQDRLDDEAE
jgi:hypothetical protein